MVFSTVDAALEFLPQYIVYPILNVVRFQGNAEVTYANTIHTYEACHGDMSYTLDKKMIDAGLRKARGICVVMPAMSSTYDSTTD